MKLSNTYKSFDDYIQKGNHDDVADIYEDQVISGYNNNDIIREKYFELQDGVVKLMDLAPHLKVLDIGIGTGFLTQILPENLQNYGIDISYKMMDILKKKNLNVKLKYGSFLEIPFKDNFFDRVVSTYAFHHIPYELQHDAFNEMNRVLMPGGAIIIGDLMFEDKRAKNKLKTYFRKQGKTDIVTDIDEEYFSFVKDSSAYLREIGFKTKYKQISQLSWIIKATKLI